MWNKITDFNYIEIWISYNCQWEQEFTRVSGLDYKINYIFFKKLIIAKLWCWKAAVYTKKSRSWSKLIVTELSAVSSAEFAGRAHFSALCGKYALAVCIATPQVAPHKDKPSNMLMFCKRSKQLLKAAEGYQNTCKYFTLHTARIDSIT